MRLASFLRILWTLVAFFQELLYLPLVLDVGFVAIWVFPVTDGPQIAGKDCMLALSLYLAITSAFNSTVHLITRNTRLRFLGQITNITHVFTVPVLLLLTLNIYSPPKSSEALFSQLESLWVFMRKLPVYWEVLLRTSSPVFVILEGISTLLCIQAVSRFTRDRIENSLSPDFFQLFCLISAAGTYVVSAYFLYETHALVTSTVTATLIGVAITSVIFLTGISFAIHKGNVVETSLIMAYAVFQIFHLSTKPEIYSVALLQQVFRATGSNGHPSLPPEVLRSLNHVSDFAGHTADALIESLRVASSALPLPVLVGLFYRVAVTYAASRIILMMKHRNEGAYEIRRLSEEEPAERVMTVIVTYSHSILIAVYTHLLLISSSGDQSFWKWLNVFLTITLWAIELKIGSSDEDEHWKSD